MGSLLSLVGLGLAPTAQAAVRAGEINIIATHSGRCVEAANSSTSAGAAVVQADCTNQTGAAWRLEESPVGGGTVLIVNLNSNRCMEAGGTAVGSTITQTDCGMQPNGSFKVMDRGSHVWLQLPGTAPAKCLEVTGGSHAANAALRVAECGERPGTAFHQRAPRSGNDPVGGGPLQRLQRVNVLPNGSQVPNTTDAFHAGSVSGDGRLVAFSSNHAHLVPGDTNGLEDAFVRDRVTGVTTRISVTNSGGQSAGGRSVKPTLSADGRYVAFVSNATNLVPGGYFTGWNVFVRDLQTGSTELVSRQADGLPGNGSDQEPVAISANGRHVAFLSHDDLIPSDTNLTSDVYLRDRQTGTTEVVSVPRAGAVNVHQSRRPSISADGRYVSFTSDAGTLVPGDTNNRWDVFVRDRQAGTTERVSVSSSEAQGNGLSFDSSISGDGRYVAFESQASDLVPGDTNAGEDVFLRDRQSGTTQRISVDPAGAQVSRVSLDPSISADGRHVSFLSHSEALVPYDSNNAGDIFVRDTQTHTTVRASVNEQGAQGDQVSLNSSISADGQHVVFESAATNLVNDDTNTVSDIFVRPVPHP